MWLFKTKETNEKVQKTYEERLLTCETEIRKLKSENLGFATDIDVIRNKVLRKIQFKRPIEQEEEDNWGGIPTQWAIL